LRLVTRGGYYVRALVRDLGRELGCRAHLTALRRVSIGPWGDPPGEVQIISGHSVLPWAPRRELTDEEERRIRGGAAIPRGDLGEPEWRCPPGFPDPDAPLRAMRRGRLEALLRESPEGLVRAMDLRGI
jgi:tRNA pseudouridine55 synthase